MAGEPSELLGALAVSCIIEIDKWLHCAAIEIPECRDPQQCGLARMDS
jgi:hypothetical protein